MERKELKLLMYCLIMCVTTGAILYKVLNTNKTKIAVVDAVKLFDNYNMKKELEELEKVRLRQESKRLDSLGNACQIAKAISNNEYAIQKLESVQKYAQASIEKEYAQSNQDINEKVWKRLNPLMEEYGKKRGLHLIIGANGMGSVLYNDDYFDLTNDVIGYVNSRYVQGN